MDTSVELFPKQSRVPTGSLGNLIKLPLSFHRKTGRRGRFIGMEQYPMMRRRLLSTASGICSMAPKQSIRCFRDV